MGVAVCVCGQLGASGCDSVWGQLGACMCASGCDSVCVCG